MSVRAVSRTPARAEQNASITSPDAPRNHRSNPCPDTRTRSTSCMSGNTSSVPGAPEQTRKSAGQSPFAAGSRIATHSTCDVIEKISAWASRRKAQVRARLSTLCPGCRRPERQMSVMTNRPSLLSGGRVRHDQLTCRSPLPLTLDAASNIMTQAHDEPSGEPPTCSRAS
jgi:hypothetical protein